MSGKRAKKARQQTGEPYFKEPKKPTRKYRTRQEEQERRARLAADPLGLKAVEKRITENVRERLADRG